MSFGRASSKDLPKDAKVLTEEQALGFQIEIIKKWPSRLEVAALRYGPFLLGAASVYTGVFLNSHFRKKLMLFHYGKLSTYLPIVVLPAASSLLYHYEFVLKDIVLMKTPCPTCIELRSAAFQALFGVIFPLILAPLGCAAVSQRYKTYYLPDPKNDPKLAFNEFKSFFKPISKKVWYMFLAHAFLGSALSYFEIRDIININKKLSIPEDELLSE
ncbi:uncharacterized protein LOC115891703 [Sitophilus oryzae]|uniref:Uncharacterized protein LOC115891703 n=1 Tax=Sitophilus oryzae TaxID=7048 RepID=A0A6J2YVG9_SITOR|nr:uncharacterized protein LOC115891703 [Sitophilus oryzae]XP_030768113.1 uncharacterized protein LOC115891703 [Sitophilus oryzae]